MFDQEAVSVVKNFKISFTELFPNGHMITIELDTSLIILILKLIEILIERCIKSRERIERFS